MTPKADLKQLPLNLRPLLPDLEATGHPWVVKQGTKHFKIMIAGRIVGTMPKGRSKQSGGPNALENVRSQIRRIAKAR